MPVDIDCYCMAIRALWVKYDHYSDSATSYVIPKLPEEYESLYTIGTIYNLFINFISLNSLVWVETKINFYANFYAKLERHYKIINDIKLENLNNLLEENLSKKIKLAKDIN